MSIVTVIEFISLFLLFLVTGVFWGLWVSISRSYDQLSITELTHIAKIIIENLAVPMRFMAMSCILFLSLSAWLCPNEAFYLILASIGCTLTALLITILIEVPINNQVITWTSSTVPSNWEVIRKRWMFFNIIRTIAALAGFGFFAAAML